MKLTNSTLCRRVFLATTADRRRRRAATGLILRRPDAGRHPPKGVLVVGTGVMGTKPWIWKNEDGSSAAWNTRCCNTSSRSSASPRSRFVAYGMGDADPRPEGQALGHHLLRHDGDRGTPPGCGHRIHPALLLRERPHRGAKGFALAEAGGSRRQDPGRAARHGRGDPGEALIAKGIGGESQGLRRRRRRCSWPCNSGQVDAVIMDNTSTRRPDGGDA